MDDERSLLLQLAESLGDDSILDELVHDTAQDAELGQLNEMDDASAQDEHISAVEKRASEINNGGIHRQIEYLLDAGVPADQIRTALENA